MELSSGAVCFYLDDGVRGFAFAGLPLASLNFRFSSRVARYESSVSAAIDDQLNAQVVFVEEPVSHARNADKKAFSICFLRSALAHCCILIMSFQLGTHGIVVNCF